MLDKRLLQLLKAIDSKIGATYKIVTKQELNEMLPTTKGKDDQLDSLLNYLLDKQYIHVKYNDEQEVCLCSTDKARAYLEHSKNNIERARLTKSQQITMFAIVSVASFVGTLLAMLIMKLF